MVEMDALTELRALVGRLARRAGELRDFGELPRLQCARFERLSEPAHFVEESMVALVVQGAKRTVLGSRTFEYGAGHVLIRSVSVPVTSQITEASAREPFLVVGLRVQPALIAGLLLKDPAPASGATPLAIATTKAPDDLLDAFRRYVRLLDAPHDIPVLGEGIEREILWRAIQGPQGAALREIGLATSNLTLIGRAIELLQKRFTEPLRMAELARVAHMSEPTFHRHFRKATAMSPLQFQKLLRLQEARVRLLARSTDVTSVSFAVGYQSPSQFSREYRRLFGVSPGEDAERLRRRARATRSSTSTP
ncbi:AraC family transcriptional regulator [Chondromyces crocatus]|uniref:AraC family transcriptional regulator n=1 Tax=Chondromyces crocatus TaxID=52 RepID=A0A0K1EQX4_CHOCO|nr:AraC family transcriptional regulator [Chondromyces crocatus]AKT43052.1 AraC family transcriptional regulator [Chondromyces crocatus]